MFGLSAGILVTALVAMLALAGVAVGIYVMISRRPRPTGYAAQEPLCRLILDGDLVREASGPLAARLGQAADLEDILKFFNPDEQHLRCSLTRLIKDGTRFDEVAQAADGDLVHVTGQPDGILAQVMIYASSPISEALYDIQSQLEVLMQERDRLRRRLTSVPMAMMELDSKGREIWANRQFRALCDQVRAPQELVELMKIPSSDPVEIDLPGGEAHWMRIVHRQSGDSTLVTAYPADDQIRAERNLSRFMTSLTDTFAHLKVGLAVFDNERRLSLFNPAISNMFDLEAAKLVARPSLREFLEALRQKRMVPEMRDFSAWRDRITDLDEGQDGGAFNEDWSLPSGQVLRVTGRPHPDGALAFLFEDITSAITLERRYRAEIEMGQGTLDSLPDAVAVIDTSGAMILANTAFEQMWQIETMAGLEAPTLNELVKVFSAQTETDEMWKRLLRFVQAATDREETWAIAIPLKDGSLRYGRFSILGSGAAMLLFRDHGSRASDRSAETQLPSVPLDGTGDPARHRMDLDLSAIGLAMASRNAATQPDWSNALHDRLRAFLAARGLTLEVGDRALPDVAPALRDQVRRLLWCLGVSAAGLARPQSTLSLSGEVRDGNLTLRMTVTTDGEPKGKSSAEAAVLPQLVADLGGQFSVETTDKGANAVITGTLPLQSSGTDAPTGSIRSAS